MARPFSVLGAILVLVLTVPATSAAALRTGCASKRPATAYRAGGRALSPQPTRRPIPCFKVVPGRSSESADVNVLRSGRILYAPLVDNAYPAPLDDRGPALLAASDSGSKGWHTITPGDDNHILDVPPWLSVDPQTQRIWFATVLPDLCGAEISWSDDGGRTWSTNPAVGCPAMGSERILEGAAPAGGARPVGYRHVVYYCANVSDLSPSTLPCYRSLDGGQSFTFTGSYPDPPPRQGCNTEHPARPGAVGTEGYLYFPVFQCGELSMAISRDEGGSWSRVHLATSNVQDLYTTSVAVDPAGNVYLAWIQAVPGKAQESQPSGGGPNPATEAILGKGRPMLSVSRDHGRTWSRPGAIGPPRVGDAEMIAIAARGIGQIAVSYLANTDGGKLLDGWLSETSNALARHPLWWAASLNDPRTPLINASDSTTFGDRLFFDTDSYGPGGLPWAAFHCAKTAACPGQRFGVVGWLQPAPVRPARRPTRAGRHRHRHPQVRRSR